MCAAIQQEAAGTAIVYFVTLTVSQEPRRVFSINVQNSFTITF